VTRVHACADSLAFVNRRGFLGLLGAMGCGAPAPNAPVAGPRVEDASISDLAGMSSVALVRAYLARIEAIDRSGPSLHAVIETNPDALAIAERIGRVEGLRGVPILVKDNIDTGDRMQTTAGSLALAGAPAPRDADVVAKLRAAGAVILGKTNLSEWANMRSDHATSGWSARGGLTKNPYVLDRNPSGSSSGSAAACAAGLAAAAIGTETVGSIVSPSSTCGLVGLKPTVGLVSARGIVPISRSFDTAGPMTRTVSDAALMLAAMSDFQAPKLDRDGARGMRVGVMRAKWTSPAQESVFGAAVEALRALGVEIVDPVEIPRSPQLFEAVHVVLDRELVTEMRAYLEARGGPMRSLADLARFNREHAAEELRWFGQDVFEAALEKGGVEAPDYAPALALVRKASRDDGIDAVLRAHRLDAIVAPTSGPAWTTDLVNGDHFGGGSAFMPAVAGYPHLTVPCGFVKELPVGISFFAGASSEATLLRIGYAYEQATHMRRPPRFLRTLA
jgi:amidase